MDAASAAILASEVIELADTLEAVEAHFRAQGWTDGLPIVPPTAARVEDMLGGIDAEPDHVVGKLPPLWGEATVEKVAINAVMAGCEPAAMPVLVDGARGDARSRLQPLRRAGDDAPGGAARDRARAGGRPARDARRSRRLRAGEPRQRDARPRHPPVSLEPGRGPPGAGRHGDAGKPRQVHLRDRGARGGKSLGPAPREPRLRRRGETPSRSSAARPRTTSTTT